METSSSTTKSFTYENVLSKQRILLVGDNPFTKTTLVRQFEKQRIIIEETRTENTEEIKNFAPHLIIFNFEKTKIKNTELCRQIRKDKSLVHIPLIILEGKTLFSNTSEIITVLENGADDYLNKSMEVELLSARIKAVLRRATFLNEKEEVLEEKGIELNATGHSVKIKGKPLTLTPKEFALLYFLLKRKGHVLTRKFLMESVWEQDYLGDPRTINKHIETLRKKLGQPAGKMIETVEGLGYKFKN